jgi:hypothetical protein
MARSIATIKESIRVKKNEYPVLSVIKFKEEGGSKVGVFNLIAFVIAWAINFHEQLWDNFKTELEDIADTAVPGTPAWLKEQVDKFQYSATTPQVVQLIDLVPQYTEEDDDLRIITRSAVTESGNGRITVKVAKSDPPEPLSNDEKTALESYLDVIRFAGTQITILTQDSDKLYVNAEVFYNGQYVSSIQTDVEDAITTYLETLPFDGVVKISKLVDAIQAVEGVNDVVINQVKARKYDTVFASATVVTREWQTIAGYIVEETTSGQTFADSITYTAE